MHAPLNAEAQGDFPTYRSWFRIPASRADPAWRLICLPHAGGSASFFYPWSRVLPPEVELVAIQYPGREERIGEPCIDNMDTMVSSLAQALAAVPQLLQRPYVLFGHSMGAAVAYELVLALQQRNAALPNLLALSASEGPGAVKPSALHRATDGALVAEIVRLNNRLEHLLHSPELTGLVLPALRSDYRLIETYGGRKPSYSRVWVPVAALVGREDSELSVDDAQAWQRIAGQGFELCSFPGGHFYLSQQFPALTEQLCRRLTEHSLGKIPWQELP
ncbi:thioesterase II family protein [Pseudomonas aeruginosa]|uniref:thioesterase II family protein n=1 Tax=Pseudomonas aeruginosa TaxID=287 RepID=UPI0003BB2B87|nr:alpha/beta fold hydrolase [Pseudomonas aeruginosa]ERX27166.1 thioesterase [Pseudomonas aeruginosa 19660]MDF5853699.1 alpha/beta fold hydrolase [Pseudomonas aeruginosa]MDF5858266.1 alpha/beta fold hydrolase [Pseudomonas aeruginosa]MDF5927033.1 alpha/beta fold hydrolase [Pseudomonas aeruginosa]MEC6485573.1 alpha/beta fold hydrolase [Pseudomonas aeruginosa]